MDYRPNKTPEPLPPPFQIRTSGVVDRNPYHSTPGTRQGDVMLTVFLGGRGTYRNSSGACDVGADMAGIVPPHDEGVLMADPQDPYLHYWCRFNGEYATHLARAILESRGARFFPIRNAVQIAEYLQQMGLLMSRDLPVVMGRREALLAQALVALSTDTTAERTTEIMRATVEEYLREHIDEPTDLTRMARHFAVSRSTLCRQVRRTCGSTVQRMHESLKVDWARVLLRTGRLRVSQVARRVGYEDPLYFSRVFARATGTSPREWAQGG